MSQYIGKRLEFSYTVPNYLEEGTYYLDTIQVVALYIPRERLLIEPNRINIPVASNDGQNSMPFRLSMLNGIRAERRYSEISRVMQSQLLPARTTKIPQKVVKEIQSWYRGQQPSSSLDKLLTPDHLYIIASDHCQSDI